MEAVNDKTTYYGQRFEQFIVRMAEVAQRRIEAEDKDAPITEEARDRALNVLDYALPRANVWRVGRDLLLAMAPKMETAGHRSGWLAYLERGLAESQHQRDQVAEAALQYQCGYLYRLMSSYAQAERLLQASTARYATLGDSEAQARSLNQLAYLAWQQHRYDEAEQFAHEALVLVGKLSLEKAVSLSVLGLIATDQNRPQAAENHHRNALEIRIRHTERRQIAWSLQNIGVALFQQGHYDTAVAHYQRALSLLEQLHDLAHQAIVQMNLALVYHAQGEARNALQIIAIAEQALSKVCDEFNLAKLLTTKGLCYLAVSQWKLAEHSFENSMQLFEKLGSYSWYLNALDGLGISYLEQELYDKALDVFESVFAQLPQIEGTLAHKYLTTTISVQLHQARNKTIQRGYSVYVPPRDKD
ncbi:MAG: tetratricopeptide repeat protein [Caldilineaceae bacterium]